MSLCRMRLVATAILLLILAACGPAPQPQAAPTPTQPPPTATIVPSPAPSPTVLAPATPAAAISATPTITESVKLDDITMYYASYGKGEPLILLHGVMTNADIWAKQVPAFAQEYQVITPDWRGQGRTTDGEGPLTTDQIAEDIVDLMDYLKIDKAKIVGWDLGATAGLQLARQHPERVKALVAYGAWSNLDDLQRFVSNWIRRASQAELKADMSYDYNKVSPSPDHLPVMFEKLLKMVEIQPGIASAQLAGIKPPVMLLYGQKEEILRLDEVKATAAEMPQAKFVQIPGVGHYAPEQKPDEFNEIVLDFLKNK